MPFDLGRLRYCQYHWKCSGGSSSNFLLCAIVSPDKTNQLKDLVFVRKSLVNRSGGAIGLQERVLVRLPPILDALLPSHELSAFAAILRADRSKLGLLLRQLRRCHSRTTHHDDDRS